MEKYFLIAFFLFSLFLIAFKENGFEFEKQVKRASVRAKDVEDRKRYSRTKTNRIDIMDKDKLHQITQALRNGAGECSQLITIIIL